MTELKEEIFLLAKKWRDKYDNYNNIGGLKIIHEAMEDINLLEKKIKAMDSSST